MKHHVTLMITYYNINVNTFDKFNINFTKHLHIIATYSITLVQSHIIYYQVLHHKGMIIFMKKHMLGRTAMRVSPVIYGGIISMNEVQDDSDRYVAWAIEKGINYFDVAPTYGDAEQKLGNSLIPYRSNVFLSCKTTERSADGAAHEMEKSLKTLHTGYFDVYQLHGINTISDVESLFGKNGAMQTLIRMKNEGIARHLGITCHNEDAALRALELYDFDTVMFPVNWAMNMGKQFGNRIHEAYKEKGFGFLGMKSLIHRAWYGDQEKAESSFPKSWCKPIYEDDIFAKTALKYAFSMDINTMVPPGNFKSFAFAVENIDECLSEPLNSDDIEYLKIKLTEIDNMYIFG